MSTSEITYYKDSSIMVSNTRAVLDSKTYAMANITSVSMEEVPANRAPGIIVALVGIAILACSASIGSDGIIPGLLVGGVGAFLAYVAKAKYIVKIGSASGESNALTSNDREYIQKIVSSINEAIIKRG